MASAAQIARFQDITNESLVKRVLEGDTALFEVLMRRHNQRLYRIARAVLREDAEAEDVMQDAYVNAYENLGQFEGRASFSTWLSRIALFAALARSANGNALWNWIQFPIVREKKCKVYRVSCQVLNVKRRILKFVACSNRR